MLNAAMFAVKQFHKKLDIDYLQDLTKVEYCETTEDTANTLADLAGTYLKLFKVTNDCRYLRMHLILEEVSEFFIAIAKGNELLALDALCDLSYVVVGSAVTFDLPLGEGFAEVHRSNMTKEKQVDDPDNARVRVKGANYQPPDLATVLKEYKDGRRA